MFVAYDVCPIIGFVPYDVYRLIGFVAYEVCQIITFFTNCDVCRLEGLSQYLLFWSSLKIEKVYAVDVLYSSLVLGNRVTNLTMRR